ncbi:hypothetical protein [Bordetella sp. BOR01]|uniref:hypothetical protein n=1 Tax=Bordetella sp. BOR01 TaxID=2854779 RepID=UPI001C4510EA|nr:hypothetical protein [Bordetella sp. BOR01]MBV7482536.1 hypothetical protein [Bordetella sp. BOR01]
MGKVLERLCRCDAERASHLLRALKVWLAYLGILCLGGMICGAPLYIWFDRTLASIKASHQEEVARLIEVNRSLLVIIQDRLPPLVDQAGTAVHAAQEAVSKAEDAAQAATGAATGARSAVTAAKGAATTARAAASTAKEAAKDLGDALEPQKPKAPRRAPKWLDGP